MTIAISPIATTSRIRTSRSSSRWSGDRRRSAIGQAAGDPADLGRRAGRDDDPLASPADDARPGVGHRPPVGEVAVACIRLRATRLRDRLAGQDAAVEQQAVDPDQAQVGRDDVAARQQDDVARDEARGGDLRHRPVAPDAGHRCAGIAERLERPLAAVLGDDIRADDREQADEHEQPVAHLAEQHRQGARREEQEHERLRGRLDDEPPDARPLRRLQLVGPDPGGAPRGLGGFEAGGRVDRQPVGNRRRRQGVRVGQRVRLRARGHVLMIGDRRQFATCRPARSGAGTGQRATMRNVTTPISSGAPSATPTGIHADRAAGTPDGRLGRRPPRPPTTRARCAGCVPARSAAARRACPAGSTRRRPSRMSRRGSSTSSWSAATPSARPGATATAPATTRSRCCAPAARAPSAAQPPVQATPTSRKHPPITTGDST